MNQSSTRTTLIIFFFAAFLCIAFFVLATYRNMKQTELVNSRTNISLQFLLESENIIIRLHEFESAQRGYIFSSKEKYASIYENALTSLLKDTATLKKLAALRPNRLLEIEALNSLIVSRIADSRATIGIFNTKGVYQAADIILKGAGKHISDSIISLVEKIENKDREVLNKSNLFLKEISQKTTYRFFGMASIFFIILIIFSFIIYNDFKKREAASARLKYQASLINTIPDAIFTADNNLTITSWNKYAAEMYGFTAEEAIGKSMKELLTVNITKEENVTSLAELRKKGFYKAEYSIRKKNNDSIFVLASVNTIINPEGEITGYIAVHRDITKRKNLEKELTLFNTELEEQVKKKTAETTNLLERITDGFLALDNDFIFTYVNKQAAEILGHSTGAMTGKNIFTDFPGTTSQQFNAVCRECYQTQRHVFLENYYAPLDIWIENDIYPSPGGLTVFFKNTTAKKKAELALKESEAHYRHLIENIPAGVVVHKPDTSILLFNHEASRLLGLSAEQMMGKKTVDSIWNFVTADGEKIEPAQYPVMQVINTRKPLYNMIGGVDSPGCKDRVWMLINGFPEFDREGKLEQVVITFVDITDRKKAEEEIRRSEDMLQMAQSIAKTGSWEFDLRDESMKWSKEMYRIFGLENTNSKDLYAAYRNKIYPEDLYKLDEAIKYFINNGKGYSLQHRIKASGGIIRHILSIGEVTTGENGIPVSIKGTSQDITEQVKAEEKLQQSYQEIRQLVNHLQNIREQERTNIAREIHDELGQQLTGLKMYISWLNKKTAGRDVEIQNKFSATIDLIEETIKSVRKISMELRPSMLDDLGLLAALEWQSNEFEKRSGIVTEFTNLTGDREIPASLKTGLFRIFQESLTNVARHAEAKKIVSSLKFIKDDLLLTISDDGKGFTVKNIESKKTLGLFGMKERTMEMGGVYDIKSKPGEGTTVFILIPVTS